MVLVYYISGHGFGHATRSLAILEQVAALRADARLIVRTRVPEDFLQRSGPAGIEVQPLHTDPGMVQIDALAIDETATARLASQFYDTFDERAGQEATVLQRLQASVVVGDIPPLAFAAAHRAGVPSMAIANFTWDWIYDFYPSFGALAPGMTDTLRAGYALATRALRMPFAGGFESMRTVARDIPLVARRSRLGRPAARLALGLSDDRPVVLGSFGGHQTALPYERIARQCAITLLMTDYELDASRTATATANLRRFSADDLTKRGVRYEDLVAAADIVVGKPGYGIVSECIANQTAFLYTSRGPFAENAVLVEAMGRVMRCRFIEQDALRAGEWDAGLRALLAQPIPAERMQSDGAEVAARAIVAMADGAP